MTDGHLWHVPRSPLACSMATFCGVALRSVGAFGGINWLLKGIGWEISVRLGTIGDSQAIGDYKHCIISRDSHLLQPEKLSG